MIARIKCCPRPEVLLILALLMSAPAAWAGGPTVKVCHVPPGHPSDFHTITIHPVDLLAHLLHGDLAGVCNLLCELLCNDGDRCTRDCDSHGRCLPAHPPVNCDDGNLCTVDSCSAAAGGCQSAPKTCADGNNCTIDACDPVTGSCVFPPVECPPGQTCNPAQTSPVCEEETVTCPCIEGVPGFLATANSTIVDCFEITSVSVELATSQGAVYSTENESSGNECGYGGVGSLSITDDEHQACMDFLRAKANAQGITCDNSYF